MAFVDEAKALNVSERSVCRLIGLNRKTINTWRRKGLQDRRKGSPRFVPHRLTGEEEELILKVCNSATYCDLPPAMIVALLAQEGSYIASESSLYRVLRKNQLLSHRQESKAPRKGKQPDRIEVTGPNQVWSWDITWLKTEVKGLFFYAYTVIDVYDRSIVGWTIEDQESDYHAHRLFSRIIRDLKVHPEVIHSDNGNPMRGMTLAAFLDSLFITRSYSRPRISNDNPFIESWHKTLKYSIGYPDTFPSIEEARVWYANFINWYNTKHLHSALGYVTPEQKRNGKSEELYSKRNETIALARLANPDRWRTGRVKEYSSLPVKTVYRPLSKIA